MKRRQRTFTLIELLVVVVIILILAAMLLPALERAVEQGKRSLCGANMHHAGVALLQYGLDKEDLLPPGNATIDWGHGIDTTWSVSNNKILGLANLVTEKYIDWEGSRALYCPSWIHPFLQYDVIDYGGVDPLFGANQFGGFPAPGSPWPTRHIGISYHYRSTFDDNVEVNYDDAPTLLLDEPESLAVSADHWTYRYVDLGQEYGHKDGFQTLYLDGHVNWLRNGLQVAGANFAQGGNTNGSWDWQEVSVWRVLFDQ
jgi:prepilin-type N-terminal cleavage/methylation domain-containing protein/prepilin-type processing-associated H-X9-DG protein